MGSGFAIVGMAAVFPGAPDLDRYWRNLRDGVDAISDVPPSRWDPVFYDPDARRPDRFYCRRGGFVADSMRFDALAYGIMPVAAEAAEPDQLLALDAAARAIEDAALARVPRDRTGVILGRGGYMTPGMARLDQQVRTAEQLVHALRAVVPGLDDEQLEAVRAEFQGQLRTGTPDATIGLVPNLAASRVANRLDLHGPAYTVDAACASSLVAVDHACAELASERCDLVLAGGVQVCHDVTFWSVFSQLGALSRSQQIRPFDRRADGLLIGEGVGVVALKRLADAERDGDRIYAVIRGTGVASDGKESSLMKPRVAGQALALTRAWEAAGLDPATVGLIEAHGTGTPTGDEAELRTLAQVFGDGAPVGIGSVKSMIGHAMPAAGVAGLIKAALAVHHGELPPTLHCDEPHPLLAETRFEPIRSLRPWESGDAPRRAGVNAFGFGGINAHVVLEQHGAGRRARAAGPVADREKVLALAAESPAALLEALDRETSGEGPCRLVVFDPTPERLAKARRIVERGTSWRGRQDIFFTSSGLLAGGGKIAFVFPGIEASFEPRIDDVAEQFRLDAPRDLGATALERQGAALVGVGRLLHAALARVGVRPDVIAGHSVGEWTGMIASGMLAPATVDGFIDSLRPGTLGTVDLLFAAVGCGAELASQAVDGLADTVVSHDNCPHQSIICGPEEGVQAALARLRKRKVLCQVLPFKSGFHTPLYADHLALHRAHLARLPLEPARVPLWSATTCAPYPDDPDQIRALFIDHLLKPVRFRELVDALYADGVRAFVLMGPSGVGGFIDDTLRGRPHLSVSANSPKRSGLGQLARTVAALWVDGAGVELGALPVDVAGGPARRAGVSLSLGAPLVSLKTALAAPAGAAPASAAAVLPAVGPSRVLAELEANFNAMQEAQRQVVEALALAPQPRPRPAAPVAAAPRDKTTRRTVSVSTDPELVDHCFYRQAAGSTNMAERFPVVPMTMNLDLMIEAASKLVPERVAIGLENVTAYRWLAVAPPVDIEIKSRFDGVDRVQVRVGDFATGTVVLADRYPDAPLPTDRPLTGERACPITAERLYEDRWMFHGPAYRGVVELGPIAGDGIRGRLVAGAARGALLDNAGQLMGFWVMRTTEVDRLAFPVRIQRLELFGPHPRPGDELDCTVWIPSIDESLVHSDMELVADGRVWARISDWVDKRFDTDEVLWPVLRYPEHNTLSATREQAYYLCTDHTRSAASRELVARRYLTAEEFARGMEMGNRRRRGWLLGRMAIRDAVRDWLWRRGHGPLFPIEIEVGNDDGGRPFVRGPFTDDLRVSVAHKEDVAVARVALGRDVGIDIERVEPRGEGFASIAFTPSERALRAGGDADEWLTRVWAAKEALAKALGTGLEGNPRRFEVKEAAGERLLVGMTDPSDPMDPVWVETRRDGDCVVAWTCD